MLITKFLACQKVVVRPVIISVVCFGINIGADKLLISERGFEVRMHAGDPSKFKVTMHKDWGVFVAHHFVMGV